MELDHRAEGGLAQRVQAPNIWGLVPTAIPLMVPEGPSAQYLRLLVPETILGMVFGTRVLKHWVLGPSGGIWDQGPDVLGT